MSESVNTPNPWSRSGSDDGSSVMVAYSPSPPSPDPPPSRGSEPIELGSTWSRSGAVTMLGSEPGEPDVIEFGGPRKPRSPRRTLMWFGGVAAAVIAVGVVVLLAMSMTGAGPLHHNASGPPNVLAPLAKACPPPTIDAQHLPPAPPPPPGPRTVDADSGISYARYGAPWIPWDTVWNAGDLQVRYGVGQHFVTEIYTDETGAANDYHASILSGSVPAAENDALTLDLKCTGHQVLADVRRSYYPNPNQMDMMRDELTTLGGRPAWVGKFRLHFHAQGLKATSELVGLALIDVGRPRAAVLYVSIPNTVNQYDPLADQVLDSVRPT
ncbi:MAG: hypothetical protein J2P15_12640 [Micromonosporaceae bacterium]|nr:hypothetical protein [Micromonosporaceae bacterium]